MNWLSPTTAIIAAGIAVPALLILYFLKLRRRDVEVSTTLLWKKAIEDLQANAPFQRLRKNILLLLQLLILAAALLAVAQPTLKARSATATRHLILIDRSASMSSQDAEVNGQRASRLEAAKEEAIRLIDSLREPGLFDKESGDQAMVIVFDTSAKALQTFTGDKNLLRSAVRAVTPSDTPSSVEEAFRLAKAQAPRRFKVEQGEDGVERTYELPSGPVGTIHLFSDGRLPDLAKAAPTSEEPVVFHAQGSPDASNLGITTLRAGRAFESPSSLSIFVGIQSTDRQPRTVDLELQIDGTVAAIKPVPIPAATVTQGAAPPEGGSAPPAEVTPALGGTVFTVDRPDGGIVTVRLSPPEGDALATDDVARLVVPPAKKLAVAVVTRGNLFIAAALESLPLAKLDTMTPEQFEQARTGRKLDYDVVILDGYLPPVPPEAALPAGRFLVLNAVPAGLVEIAGGGPAVFLDWSRDHPALRGLRLEPVQLGKVRAIEVPRGVAATVVATSDVGPAIIELSTAEARSLVLPFDVGESSWPFDVSFVVFMAQAVGYLGDEGGAEGRMVQPGGVLSDRLPPGARDVRVRTPDGSLVDVGAPSPDGTVVFGPLERTGVYQISWSGAAGPTDAVAGGRATRTFAANLLDGAESDLAAATTLELASANVAAAPEDEIKVARPLWPWLLLAALGIVMLEWFVYNRKVQV